MAVGRFTTSCTQHLRQATLQAVLLSLLGISTSFAQRPLCNQLPASDRNSARAAGLCRDPAPIIDVAPPRAPDEPLPPAIPSTAPSLAVPNVVGQSFDEARSRLARFTLQRSYRAAAEAGGTVLAQSPMAPATLPAGAPVTLVLSDGSLVRVPRVANLNINDARQRLQKDLDLKAQPVVVTSELRVGTVIEQQPVEGTLVKRGSVVRLQVSAGQEGPELIDVPSVVGMPFDKAKSRLSRFAIERIERPRTERSSAPEGQVIEQSPRAASRAAAGSVIVLTVAGAPRGTVEIFEMPNVVGRAYTDAARSLAEFKVTRSEIASAEARGRIVAQTPAAGVTLLPGDAVALQISAGPSAVSTTTADANAKSVAPPPTSTSSAKLGVERGVFRGVLAISAAIVLGLIFGALLMRHWVFRQRAVAAADDAITAMTPVPPVITSVDILLEEKRDDERGADVRIEPLAVESPAAASSLSETPPSEQPEFKANEDSENASEQEKHSGPSGPHAELRTGMLSEADKTLESPRSK
ncbi:MAG TPA: PASTA domain-containing protein [Burkholderiaceae bacterium]|nr:PASTA domain-containing protein [Burkholderiaceae bacterium]